MRRALIVAALVALGAGTAHAQMTKAIGKARKAAGAADAHVAAEQNTEAQVQGKKAPAKPAPPPAAAKGSTQGTALGTGTGGKVGPHGRVGAKLDTVPTFVMREAFDYDRTGTRDPFVSLLNTSELRPVLSDLHLIGIIYDPSGHRSVAVMRDQTNKLYRATVGQALGRMRVAQIRPHAVIFTIEEFGFSRQDSLVLIDSTKARIP